MSWFPSLESRQNGRRILPYSDARGNHDGESIMIDPDPRMNQIATAFEHDKRREKAAAKPFPRGESCRWA
jgi:hypothetical protein